jgi:hypothetical protein
MSLNVIIVCLNVVSVYCNVTSLPNIQEKFSSYQAYYWDMFAYEYISLKLSAWKKEKHALFYMAFYYIEFSSNATVM